MSPTPLSLLCALLLTLPLAILFTINTDTTTTLLPPLLTTISPPPTLKKNVHAPRKVAFMFLTTGPLPFAPLWELYFNSSRQKNLYNIYIHADPSLRHDLIFNGVFTNRTIPSKPTRRHTPSLAAAHRRLLMHALLHDPLNYHFALLSPSCIPLHSFDFTYKTLAKSNKSFIEILENEPSAWGRWAARGEKVMLPEVEFKEFRIGSQFSILTRQHAMVAVNDTCLWYKFKLPCLHEKIRTCYPEENYLPTLMSMVDKDGCVPATLTYVDWKGGYHGHPHLFARSEVGPDLIRTIRGRRPRYGNEEVNGSNSSMIVRQNDPFLFARKFGSNTLGALLDIAEDVILRD